MHAADTIKQHIAHNKHAKHFDFSIDVNRTFTTCGDGYWSNKQKDVYVTSISMYVCTQQDEHDWSGDGDLAVNYTEATWDNAVDGLIYTDTAFIAQVRTFLIAQGFDAAAVADINYSEQGMQDNGRVSCDAYAFANYLRNAVM
jgi:hypothetical protein